jgi:hypothetical protein
MEVKINGYKFTEKEMANATRAELAVELGLPRKLGDVTIYWQNYQEATLNKPSFFYMVGDKSMTKALGKPSTFTVIFPDKPKEDEGKIPPGKIPPGKSPPVKL